LLIAVAGQWNQMGIGYIAKTKNQKVSASQNVGATTAEKLSWHATALHK
jgi:hypothetical protein